MSFPDLQAAWARWLVDGLMSAGVNRAIVSPGSRSTPIVLAIGRAEAAGRLDSRVIVDERSAAFYALGQARATGEPTLLVCTSGTAGAHYLPAIVEAGEAHVPLVVVTADRPPELRRRGAAQTIEQPGMFGRFVRASFDLGLADADPRAVDGLLRTAALAVHAAAWPAPGAVHINAAFRKPFEPTGMTTAQPELEALEHRVAETIAAGRVRPPDLPSAAPSGSVLDAVADRLRAAGRGVIVCGPGPTSGPTSGARPGAPHVTPHAATYATPHAESLARLAAATGFPVLAEATSQLRFGGTERPTPALDVSEPLFASPSFRATGAPDFVLQVGAAPTGRALGAWLATSGVERIVLARYGVPEAFNQASRVVIGDLDLTLQGLAERLAVDPGSRDVAWAGGLAPAVERARELAAEAAAEPGSQGGAVRAAVQAIPSGGQLMLGNSMPVRDVDLYVPAGRRGLRVLSQRGAGGIDGLIAGAVGAASATGRPTLLLLGDVSFQHDVGSLAVLADVDAPLAIVVVANGGGRLFELLPVRHGPEAGELFDRYFVTPPAVSVRDAARAFDVRFVRAADAPTVEASAAEALTTPGATIIEAVVAPDGAEVTRRIAGELEAWLAAREGCFGA